MTTGYSDKNLEEKLLQPYYHILQVRGKLLRKKIPLAFNHWLKVPEDKLCEVVDVVNMLHNASLLLDDIQDHSLLRRTIPAAHCVYGTPLVINTAIHVFCLAMEKLYNIGHPQAPRVYAELTLEAIRGQGVDIYWRENHICPSEADYKRMAEQKTGAMYNMNVKMLQLFSDNKTDFTKLSILFGVYFQIRDDYCNLNQQEALEDWPSAFENVANFKEEQLCEDITEGKFSLPIIHALQFPEGAPLMKNFLIIATLHRGVGNSIIAFLGTNQGKMGATYHACLYFKDILKQRTRDKNLKKYCISLLNKLGSMQYTRDFLMALHREVEAEIARLGGNSEMDKVLAELLTWKDN